ncbi:MAG: DUF4286 family protein [Flavobacteriales bacterium]|nr:hypothetical protein [Flavobacteriales bacterium]MCC6575870.1 DUF4286 family protein [Flavobacteriales bacterium]NUQ14171.1 DUF4286 family protein [Flavobacteriales bacterium]
MIVYNVTINVDAEVAEEWLHWMRTVHVPDVMATGLFLDHRIMRVLADDEGGLTYAVQYTCADMATYERYRDGHAARLQAETQQRYGGRFAAFRTLLEVLHTA